MARVYGSRTAGIEKENSDVDVVIEFQGDIQEDDFFNMLHEDGLSIGGMAVDINPVTAEKSGTIEEYLARANEYLEEKVKSFREAQSDQKKVEVTAEKPVQSRESRKNAEDFDKECNQLAAEIDSFSEEYDPYGYRDAVKNREENISSIYHELQNGGDGHLREWMQSVIDEEEPAEDVKRAKELLKRMDDLAERRERNPLTKVEELKEANYNQDRWDFK